MRTHTLMHSHAHTHTLSHTYTHAFNVEEKDDGRTDAGTSIPTGATGPLAGQALAELGGTQFPTTDIDVCVCCKA